MLGLRRRAPVDMRLVGNSAAQARQQNNLMTATEQIRVSPYPEAPQSSMQGYGALPLRSPA